MTEESRYYFRYLDSVTDRLDENYNNPRYDEIDSLLKKAEYPIVRLGEKPNKLDQKYLLRIVSGKTPKNIRYEENGGIPFIGATSIRDGKVDLSVAPRIPVKIHNSTLKSSQIHKNDVLITMAGFYIGRCGVYETDDECNANQAVAILSPNTAEIESYFLARFYNSYLGQLFFGKLQHIAGQPNINLDEILKIPLVLPPKPIQTQITKSVDEKLKEANVLEDKAKQQRSMAQSDFDSALVKKPRS